MNKLLVQWSANRATRCAEMSGALGVPWRTLPYGQNVALYRTLSPSLACGSVQADDHCGCTTPAPRSDGGQPWGRPRKEKRHHRSRVPRDALLRERSAFRLLAMASPDWMIYGTS